MAASARKLVVAPRLAAREALGLGFGPGPDGALPWDVVEEKLSELLRFLASALQALAGEIRDRAAALARWARVAALPAAVAVAVLVVVCCCCGYCAAAGRRRRRGPDGEEVEAADGRDGPVLRYHPGGVGDYKGGVFSMHPNKPIVC